jgi:protein O-mannosyl-transferase
MPRPNGWGQIPVNVWSQTIIPGTLIVLAVFLAYLPALHCGYIWDDDVYVTQNPLLTAPDGLWRIWFSLDSPSQYFPLTYTSFLIERAFWGLNPAGYHAVNLLLHAANALLLWRLLRLLRVPGAWLAAAIFALHPMQVESVAWITERKNVLMGFFFLIALQSWTRFVDDKTDRAGLRYAAALIFYLLALTAKTTACTMPAALLLILWFKKIPIDRWRLAQVAPFVIFGAVMGLVAVWWERFHQGTHGSLFDIGPVERGLIASRAIWFYLGKLLCPANLIFSYHRWTISASDPLAWLWPAATMALALIIYWMRRFAGRNVEVAALFFATTLGPVSGFIMLYTFRYSFVADHYQYLACIGPISLASAGIILAANVLKNRKRVLVWVACAALLFVLGNLTWRQCENYADEETLWRATLARNPNCFMAYNNLGRFFYREGQVDKAMGLYRKAIQIEPDGSEAYANLGVALAVRGMFDKSIANYRKAIQINPNYFDVLNNLGAELADKGLYGEAVQSYRKSCQINPNFAGSLNNLAWILATCPDAKLRNGNEAVRWGERACALTHYQRPMLIGTLAAAYAEAGRFPEAVATAEKAEQLATQDGIMPVAEKNRQLIELYQTGKAYHETGRQGSSSTVIISRPLKQPVKDGHEPAPGNP